MNARNTLRAVLSSAAPVALFVLASPRAGVAQMPSPLPAAKPASVVRPADPMTTIPVLAPRVGEARSELAPVVEEFAADQTSLSRRYDAADSPAQRKRMREFY